MINIYLKDILCVYYVIIIIIIINYNIIIIFIFFIIYKDNISEAVNEAICEFYRPSGGFIRIFPLKDNIKSYMKFFEKPDEENKALWEELLK